MAEKFNVTEVEEVKPMHIKQYIRYCQQLGKEKAITINGSIATLRVFFNDLVEEESIGESDNPMRRIKNLKEVRKVIHTFTDEEVKRILRDVTEYTYSNVRDKLILIFLFDTWIRVSELCDIKVQDVTNKHIVIHDKGSKERLIYVSRIMRRYMRKYEALKKQRFKINSQKKLRAIIF